MTLIRDRKVVEDDTRTLADDAPLPSSGKIIISLARWEKEQSSAAIAPLKVGVRLPNTVDIRALWPRISSCVLIALEFPVFPDGRAYSQARQLRDACGYLGEIRACGAAVVRDQMAGMQRCGITAFELRADQDAQSCLQALEAPQLAYQPAAESLMRVVRDLRHIRPADGV